MGSWFLEAEVPHAGTIPTWSSGAELVGWVRLRGRNAQDQSYFLFALVTLSDSSSLLPWLTRPLSPWSKARLSRRGKWTPSISRKEASRRHCDNLCMVVLKANHRKHPFLSQLSPLWFLCCKYSYPRQVPMCAVWRRQWTDMGTEPGKQPGSWWHFWDLELTQPSGGSRWCSHCQAGPGILKCF